MRVARKLFPFLMAVLMLLPAWAKRDPLNNKEIDELREAAQEPNDRLKLIVQFARARLESLEAARNDPKLPAAERADRIHDLLEDFTSIYDELGDNLDMYSGQKADFRKAMHVIIEGDAEFQNRLRAFHDAVTSDPAKYQTKEYQFVLENAMDAVNAGVKDHRDVLNEQNELAKERKKHK
jgi:hypothetical protein